MQPHIKNLVNNKKQLADLLLNTNKDVQIENTWPEQRMPPVWISDTDIAITATFVAFVD